MTDQWGHPLRVEVDASGVLKVHGDIDVAGGPMLEAYVARYENGQPIVIDLGGVDFIDSSGLRTLLGASRRAELRGTKVQLRNVGPAVRRMLDITGTSGHFQLQE